MIGLTGRIQTRSYDNQQGQRVYVTEVVAESVALLESRNKQQTQAPAQPSSNYTGNNNPFSQPADPFSVSDDVLPF